MLSMRIRQSNQKYMEGEKTLAYKPKVITEPGAVVSVDQLVSPTPGFISQMTGRLPTKRYNYATVFVEQSSKLGYIYIQETNNPLKTLEAKKSFQQHSMDRGVVIKAYHADNGIFRSNDWKKAYRNERQQLTFSGVNTHFTNRPRENTQRSTVRHGLGIWRCVN